MRASKTSDRRGDQQTSIAAREGYTHANPTIEGNWQPIPIPGLATVVSKNSSISSTAIGDRHAFGAVLRRCINLLSSSSSNVVDRLRTYNVNSAFSGVYNSGTGSWLALASEGAALSSGGPVTVVRRFGGHSQAEAALMNRFGGLDSRVNVGFVMFLRSADTIQVTFRSGQINQRNFQQPDAPANYRQNILDAISNSFPGMTVNG